MKIYNPTGFSTNLTGSFSGSVKGTLTATGNIIPDVSGAYDIGSTEFPFKDLYITQNSLKFIDDTTGNEIGRISVNSNTGDIKLLNTKNLTEEEKATLTAENAGADALSPVSASALWVSQSISPGHVNTNIGHDTAPFHTLYTQFVSGSSATLTGHLTVGGKVTAQEFHTEFVSASIIYESGSTKFGNSSDDTHVFEGQLFISASDSENILTSKNRSATGAPEQFKIKHSSGGVIVENLRGGLTLTGGGIILSGSDVTLHDKLQDSVYVSSFLDFNAGGDTVLSSNNDTKIGYLQNTYIKQSGNVGIKTSSAGRTLVVNGDFQARGLWTNTSSQTFWGNEQAGTAYGYLTWDSGYGAISGASGSDLRLGADQTDYIYVKQSGTIGFGAANPSYGLRAHFAGKTESAGASGIAPLGTAFSSSVAMFSNKDESYGTLLGTLSSGTGWIQQQRVDGTPTGYDLLLQPNAGNVGIGTTSTSWKLLVNSSNNLTSFFQSSDTSTIVGINNTNVSGDPQIKFYRTGIGKFTLGVDHSDGEKFKIATTDLDTNPRLVIDSGGQIGISTTVPRSLLHVARRGNVNGGTLLIGDGDSGTNKWSFLAGAHRDQATGSGNGVGAAGIALIGSYADSTENTVYIGGGPYEINAATKIVFHTHTSNLSTLGGSPRMIINSNGNVGIGTSSPDKKLTISGPGGAGGPLLNLINSTGSGSSGPSIEFNGGTIGNNHRVGSNLFVAGDFAIYDTNNSARMFFIDPNGNVGIGTTSPFAKLDIDGQIQIGGASGTPNVSYGMFAYSGVGLGIYSGAGGSTQGIGIWMNNGSPYEAIRILSGGNVGIGTTSPTQKLDVRGSVSVLMRGGDGATEDVSYSSFYTEGYPFNGRHEISLGSFIFRAGSRYLDLKLSINSDSYMFGAKANGYLYNSAVMNAEVGGYAYSGTIINYYTYVYAAGGNTLNAYRASTGHLCLRLDRGNNGYSEGRVYVYFYAHGSVNPATTYVTDYIQNDSATNYYA